MLSKILPRKRKGEDTLFEVIDIFEHKEALKDYQKKEVKRDSRERTKFVSRS